MKRIKFDFFGPGQEIYFDIGRFAMLENITGKAVSEIITSQNFSINLLTAMLSVGLRHYGHREPAWYMEQLQKLIDDGVELKDIQLPVVKAVAASGIMGKDAYYTIFPEEKTAEDTKALAAEAKN